MCLIVQVDGECLCAAQVYMARDPIPGRLFPPPIQQVVPDALKLIDALLYICRTIGRLYNRIYRELRK